MTDPILYLSMILGLTGVYVLISSFSDDDDDSNDDGERYIYDLEYVKVGKQLFITLIDQTQRITSLIKPASIHLIKRPMKKLNKRYVELLHQGSIATGRKEAVGLLHKAAKLKTKFDNHQMMQSN